MWNCLLREYPMSTVAPFSLLVPVFGVLGSVLIFNEPLPPLKLVAGALIAAGLVIGSYGERVTESRATDGSASSPTSWGRGCGWRRATEPVVATAGAFDLKRFHQQALELGSMGLDLLRTELTSKPGPAVLPSKS
ncbi:EamA family transporter [Streptomyces sp. NBC_00090]|uniref:EamA family transporter n=1 Tax=Streptomyces sp. NBC_00090 TaxID=2903619 RepID=UPI00324C5FA5